MMSQLLPDHTDKFFFVPDTPPEIAESAAVPRGAADLGRARAAALAVTAALADGRGRQPLTVLLLRLAAELRRAATHFPPELPADFAPELADQVRPGSTTTWKEAAHDGFFRVWRGPRTRDQWLGDRLRLFADVALELDWGVYDRDTMLTVLRFVAGQLAVGGQDTEADPSGVAEPDPSAVDTLPLTIWRRGHHFLATACVAARQSLAMVRSGLDGGDPADAIRGAALGVEAIRAVSASYSLAGEFSSETYQYVVRPRMCPPETAVEMNGALNTEYRTYVQDWIRTSRFLQAHRGNFRDGTWATALIGPLESLFLTAVMEAHAHVASAWRLVGGATALHQDVDSTENGVMVLQDHVTGRLADYREFIAG